MYQQLNNKIGGGRSNFELLRIISMLLVLLVHYVPIRLSMKSFANLLYQMLFWSGASVLTAFAIGLYSTVALFLKGIVWG